MISLYVDDINITCNSSKLMDEVKGHLSKVFEMKDLGEFHYCLGLKYIEMFVRHLLHKEISKGVIQEVQNGPLYGSINTFKI